jgi:glucose/arabinose dehydrogenase
MDRSVITVGVSLLFVPVASGGTPQEPDFVEEVFVADNALNDTTGMAWAPDGSNRLFLGRKSGDILIIKDGALLGTAFATEPSVYTFSECGLVGICFDRRFTTTHPYLYAFVTVSSSEQIIVRYNASGDTGTDRTPILEDTIPTHGANHDGGAIAMGPDHHIYFACGDLGSHTGVDLDITTLASKVGRCDWEGNAVAENPFYDAADGINATDYIWAGGFRNPFTMTFHPVTGHLWLSVVGSGPPSGHEQVFLVGEGDHGGWNDVEGATQPPAGDPGPYTAYIVPKISYPTNQSIFGGCISGGAFNDGSMFPAKYQHNFFWGDYNINKIMRSTLDATHQTVLNTTTFVTDVSNVVDVSVGPDGALYYVGRSGSAVYRLSYSGVLTPGDIPGDCNQDATLDISDAVCALGALFTGNPMHFPCGDGTPTDPGNLALIDWQPDGSLDLSDPVGMLQFLFSAGAAHPLAVPGSETTECVSIDGCVGATSCP